jgi:hypothetical protein
MVDERESGRELAALPAVVVVEGDLACLVQRVCFRDLERCQAPGRRRLADIATLRPYRLRLFEGVGFGYLRVGRHNRKCTSWPGPGPCGRWPAPPTWQNPPPHGWAP